jgi:hypothetical protein
VKFILWLGIFPLYYGLKFFWKWVVVDKRVWDYLPEEYKQGLPLRIIAAIALIVFGLYLFFGVGDFLGQRF